jgi:hypothetical protein
MLQLVYPVVFELAHDPVAQVRVVADTCVSPSDSMVNDLPKSMGNRGNHQKYNLILFRYRGF